MCGFAQSAKRLSDFTRFVCIGLVFNFALGIPNFAIADTFEPRNEDTPASSAADFIIRALDVSGNASVTTDRLNYVLSSFLQKPLSMERLENIRATIFDEYTRNGLLCRVSLPPQDLSSGVVQVLIEEVTLGEIIISAPDDLRFSTTRAARYLRHSIDEGAALEVSALDERTKLLDEFAGISAETRILPLGETASADVKLVLENTPLLATTLQADNLGG